MFHVIAGKYDANEENCKYADSFTTIKEAVQSLKKVEDYPWSRIECDNKEEEALLNNYFGV